jgi:hypothetical protein
MRYLGQKFHLSMQFGYMEAEVDPLFRIKGKIDMGK